MSASRQRQPCGPNMLSLMLRSAFVLLSTVVVPHLTAQVVATVGAGSITRQQLELRIATERTYGARIEPSAALTALITEELERQVARSLGLIPDSSELQRFSEHADKTSKAPDILAAV